MVSASEELNPEAASEDYTVRLEQLFQGPMDLLLHLVREQEVDIHEIEINRVIDGYLEYMRQLEKAAPGRVKVISMGTSEEGREMIAVAIASEAVLAKMTENRTRLAKLADPRLINLDDAS